MVTITDLLQIVIPIIGKFDPSTTPIRNDFFCGTEQGDVLYTSTKLVKDGDSGKFVAPQPEWSCDAHAGPITSVERNRIILYFAFILVMTSSTLFSTTE